MAKHRKTREEKIRASLRHQLPAEPPIAQAGASHTHTHLSYTLPTRPTTLPLSSATTTTYAYVAEDLKKTLFITGTIIVAQIILFALLQTR